MVHGEKTRNITSKIFNKSALSKLILKAVCNDFRRNDNGKNISKTFSISGLKIEMCVNFPLVLAMEEIVNIKEMQMQFNYF